MPEPKPVVLILDDEPMVTDTIKNLLDLGGVYRTVVFHYPPEALEFLKRQPVDVIISDQMMPGMSGLEFFAQAKLVQPEAIRVLLTGYAQKEDAVRALNESGVFQFVEKPWSNEHLTQVIRRGLERKQLYTALQGKIGELQIAGDQIDRLKDGLVALYLEKGEDSSTRGELRRLVGREIRFGARRLMWAFGLVSLMLVASVSYILYSNLALRRETTRLRVQIGEIRGRQLNPVEVERLRMVAATPSAQPGAGERIIAQYEGSVCLIEGAYRFIDGASGKVLRMRAAKAGADPQVDSSGSVELTVEGDGPPLENFHTGTGFVASADGKILTNRHVAEPWWADAQAQKFVEAGFRPQYTHFAAYFPRRRKAFPLKVVKVSESADLAVLEATPREALPAMIPLENPARRTPPGASILLMAYPLGLEALVARASPKELEQIPGFEEMTPEQVTEQLAQRSLIAPFITQGHISNVTDELLVYDAVTTLGGSGGPVFNLDGKVIAVNFAILTQFSGASMGVPIRHALDLLKK